MTKPLELTRSQILGFRRCVGALGERLPSGRRSLQRAAWAGLQDSMPRAGLLSIHARVEKTSPTTLDDPSLVQLWGPRFSVYVVADRDRAVFTLGRLPDGGVRRQLGEDLADRLDRLLDGGELDYGDAGRLLGESPNRLRYAAPTGRVVLTWDGARRPLIRMVPPPEVDPKAARLELARRYLRVFGPGTADAFAGWAGIQRSGAHLAFESLIAELTPVTTPLGEAWILTSDEPEMRADPKVEAGVRLLPSGDAFYLLHGPDRELLVPDPDHRAALWTSRVWPGAVLVDGEIVGTWRRSRAAMSIEPWRALSNGERQAIEAEAASLPLPGIGTDITVRWGE